ncbi:MAG: TonB C-terminal domain-containing protein [Deltaproteobacteria bacterium]|nr:TonB C-terminal domain-containing protein [Deltaproteobacteria bacterium]
MLFFSLVITTIPAQANDERQVGKQTGAIVKEKSQYYAQLRRFIRSNWQPFQAYRAPNLVVEFIIFIQPDGTISDKRLRKSSGNQDFDQMVGWAIDRTKLPPLPPAFNGQTDRPALSISCDYLSEK